MTTYNSGISMEKKCIRCFEVKKITSFKQDIRTIDGRTRTCRHCYTYNKLIDKTYKSPENKEAHRKKLLGRKYTLAHRQAISRGQIKVVKEGRHHWKKNDVPHKDTPRNWLGYKIWREKVFELKGRKCETCGSDKRLHVHHLNCFYKFPNLRTEVRNGQVLCISCHMKLTYKEVRERRQNEYAK